MRKIIFLDIDGVLANESTFGQYVGDHYPFDHQCVEHLNHILAKTDADIVLSSSWRNCYSLQRMNEIFKAHGIIKPIIDVTPEFEVPLPEMNDPMMIEEYAVLQRTAFANSETTRVNEIRDWLSRNPDVTSWVAIDDYKMIELNPNIVITSHRFGMSKADADDAVMVLSREYK